MDSNEEIKNLNCYMQPDPNPVVKEEERTMVFYCEECRNAKHPGAWFYEGSRYGYGPFDFMCEECGKVLHQHVEEEEEEEIPEEELQAILGKLNSMPSLTDLIEELGNIDGDDSL